MQPASTKGVRMAENSQIRNSSAPSSPSTSAVRCARVAVRGPGESGGGAGRRGSPRGRRVGAAGPGPGGGGRAGLAGGAEVGGGGAGGGEGRLGGHAHPVSPAGRAASSAPRRRNQPRARGGSAGLTRRFPGIGEAGGDGHGGHA